MANKRVGPWETTSKNFEASLARKLQGQREESREKRAERRDKKEIGFPSSFR